ncbi:hypothetical protein DFQ14_101627 [Halopolyspora algeriensis]|uniref:Uncharacterized protein n=1 Tax=Halopolyspora algeriensis TaxID=1500506 RepID=A0A368VYI8_9ACTN|nr:hypothetical protein [Halopolyspora algeriensis]RCW47278.1 hypothetical protein DFQ14_101627 [Halopolyspora algeriensis]
MPGVCQIVTGIFLFAGLTLFQVFTYDAPLYMAALAFSAYGIHWLALGWNRYRQHDPRPNVGMAVAFVILSVLGAVVFYAVGNWAVGILFTGLTWVYVSEIPASLGTTRGERSLGAAHTATGIWLMYLTFAVVLNYALGFGLPA